MCRTVQGSPVLVNAWHGLPCKGDVSLTATGADAISNMGAHLKKNLPGCTSIKMTMSPELSKLETAMLLGIQLYPPAATMKFEIGRMKENGSFRTERMEVNDFKATIRTFIPSFDMLRGRSPIAHAQQIPYAKRRQERPQHSLARRLVNWIYRASVAEGSEADKVDVDNRRVAVQIDITAITDITTITDRGEQVTNEKPIKCTMTENFPEVRANYSDEVDNNEMDNNAYDCIINILGEHRGGSDNECGYIKDGEVYRHEYEDDGLCMHNPFSYLSETYVAAVVNHYYSGVKKRHRPEKSQG